MILAAIFLAAQVTSHPRELPVTAIEWLDHYHYCLKVNFTAVLDASPAEGRNEAARRATVRCWPVQSSASSKIIEHLERDGGASDPNERQEIAERMLTIAASAFALEVGVRLPNLGPLSAR